MARGSKRLWREMAVMVRGKDFWWPKKIGAMRRGNEMVSSLYDGVILINQDGNMRNQYNYFEVLRLD